LMELPSTEIINDQRIAKFKQRISDTLAINDLSLFSQLIEQYQQEHNTPAVEIGAALAKLLQGDTPLLLQNKPTRQTSDKKPESLNKKSHKERNKKQNETPEKGMERYRIEVGHEHNVKPGNIVGAIASEAGLESKYIGQIKIFNDHSLVDLPEGMPKDIFRELKKTRVAGQQIRISRFSGIDSPKRSEKRMNKKRSKNTKSRNRKARKT
ncbi:MAG: DbpA RNA binding domain-containing protein, partial [Pseudomonadota bacterium]